jgi:hypothetical protein
MAGFGPAESETQKLGVETTGKIKYNGMAGKTAVIRERNGYGKWTLL